MSLRIEEYRTLRQEILQDLQRRVTILSVGLTVAVAVFGFSIQADSWGFMLPLFVPILLNATRVQLIQAEYSVHRIASYLRVVHENPTPGFPKWETANYLQRKQNYKPPRRIQTFFDPGLRVSAIRDMDKLLFISGFVAFGLSAFLAVKMPLKDWELSVVFLTFPIPGGWSFGIFVVLFACYFAYWIWSWQRRGKRIEELENQAVDQNEGEFWRDFMQKNPLMEMEIYAEQAVQPIELADADSKGNS